MKKEDIRGLREGFRRSKIFDLFLDLIFPRRCPFCDGIVNFGDLICRSCKGRISYTGEDHCLKCGKKLLDNEREYCRDCMHTVHLFERGRSLYVYNGNVRAAITRFKFRGRKEYSDFFGRDMVKHLGSFIIRCHPDIIIPVPVSKEKMKKRGYNQSELLAESISEQTGIPVNRTLIIRIKNTPPMKELSRIERMKNLKGAFKINVHDVKCRNVLIVDDIYTTGSTIDAMTEELKKAGIQNVYFVALAAGSAV